MSKRWVEQDAVGEGLGGAPPFVDSDALVLESMGDDCGLSSDVLAPQALTTRTSSALALPCLSVAGNPIAREESPRRWRLASRRFRT